MNIDYSRQKFVLEIFAFIEKSDNDNVYLSYKLVCNLIHIFHIYKDTKKI